MFIIFKKDLLARHAATYLNSQLKIKIALFHITEIRLLQVRSSKARTFHQNASFMNFNVLTITSAVTDTLLQREMVKRSNFEIGIFQEIEIGSRGPRG
jgi:hypothetical protein